MQKCLVESPYTMECVVPEISSSVSTSGVNVTETSPLEVHYGFNMDGVLSVKNVSQTAIGPLLIYPNPHVFPFPGDDQTKQHSEKHMIAIKVGNWLFFF